MPRELLSCVSPVLLAVIFQHLPHAHAQAVPSVSSSHTLVHVYLVRLWQLEYSVSPFTVLQMLQVMRNVNAQGLQADLRAAVLLLLTARCKGSPAALSAAGGFNAFLAMLKDDDVRIRHVAAAFLQVISWSWVYAYRTP